MDFFVLIPKKMNWYFLFILFSGLKGSELPDFFPPTTILGRYRFPPSAFPEEFPNVPQAVFLLCRMLGTSPSERTQKNLEYLLSPSNLDEILKFFSEKQKIKSIRHTRHYRCGTCNKILSRKHIIPHLLEKHCLLKKSEKLHK